MAKAVYEGASCSGAAVTMKKAADAIDDDLFTCDTIVGSRRNKDNGEIYCKYQCGVYIKRLCEQVLGFGISFEPKEVECIYRVKRI